MNTDHPLDRLTEDQMRIHNMFQENLQRVQNQLLFWASQLHRNLWTAEWMLEILKELFKFIS